MRIKYTPLLTFGLLALFQVLFFVSACTNDELPPPVVSEACDTLVTSYNINVKTIIDESCAYSGCHDGSGGIGPGNYSSYGGLEFFLNSGLFRTRVLNSEVGTALAMPPSNSTYPQSQKDSLTSEERQIIECWLDTGYPESL